MFEHHSINFEALTSRAFNLRWATVEEGVIPLTAADPDFPCSPLITEAIAEYIKPGYLNYGPAEGLPSFKQALQDFFAEKRNYHLPYDQILPIDSAAFGIQVVCNALLRPGDEAIIFDPVDFLFQYCIEQVQGIPIRFLVPQTQVLSILTNLKPKLPRAQNSFACAIPSIQQVRYFLKVN